MNTTEILKGPRKYKRIVPSKEDRIYCIVSNDGTAVKSLSLMAMDLSENGFKFSLSRNLTGYFRDGEKLFLKGISGSVNITFEDPVELTIRWLKHHVKQNLVDVGFEVSCISENSRKQLIDLINSDLFVCQTKQQSNFSSNVLSLFGGQRVTGNTARVLCWIEEQLRATGHTVERVNMSHLKLMGCLRCFECKKNIHSPKCVQKDDLMFIISKMLRKDAVIFASPLYSRFLSVQMRALFDRFNCLFRGEYGSSEHTSFVEGQLQALVLTSIDQYEEHAEQIVKSFQRLIQLNKAHPAGKLIVCNCSTPDKLGESIQIHATNFAEQLFTTKLSPYALLIPRTRP
jgi:multimeric flavodoxin WrbA